MIKEKSYQEEQQDVEQNIKEILLQQLKEQDILLFYHMLNNSNNIKRAETLNFKVSVLFLS